MEGEERRVEDWRDGRWEQPQSWEFEEPRELKVGKWYRVCEELKVGDKRRGRTVTKEMVEFILKSYLTVS